MEVTASFDPLLALAYFVVVCIIAVAAGHMIEAIEDGVRWVIWRIRNGPD